MVIVRSAICTTPKVAFERKSFGKWFQVGSFFFARVHHVFRTKRPVKKARVEPMCGGRIERAFGPSFDKLFLIVGLPIT